MGLGIDGDRPRSVRVKGRREEIIPSSDFTEETKRQATQCRRVQFWATSMSLICIPILTLHLTSPRSSHRVWTERSTTNADYITSLQHGDWIECPSFYLNRAESWRNFIESKEKTHQIKASTWTGMVLFTCRPISTSPSSVVFFLFLLLNLRFCALQILLVREVRVNVVAKGWRQLRFCWWLRRWRDGLKVSE